jgi:acetyl esterase
MWGSLRLERILELRDRVRQNTGAAVANGLFRGLSTLGRLHPLADPRRHNVEVLRDIPYLETGQKAHLLDVYRPAGLQAKPLPIVLYVHGGAFRILSKDSHWVMGLGFARSGYLVFNINYRLAPKHPFPAAVADTCAAFAWVVRHAARYGGDPERVVLAGESAGANLVTSLAIATCYERKEPFARIAFESGVTPRAVLPACGILQVSNIGRFSERKRISPWVNDRLLEIAQSYIGNADAEPSPEHELADPLLVFERGDRPARALPPFFVVVGTKDPLLDDSRRLKAALDRMGVYCDTRYYPGEAHAFHALVFREAARRCWGHTFRFLDRQLREIEEELEETVGEEITPRMG